MKTIKLLSVALLATFALTPLSAQKSKRKDVPKPPGYYVIKTDVPVRPKGQKVQVPSNALPTSMV